MDPIGDLLLLFLRRVKYPRTSLGRCAALIDERLKKSGLTEPQLTNEMLHRLVEEAYRRAAEQERDNIARYGPLFKQIEVVADESAKVLRNDAAADGRVRRILEFGGVVH